MGANESAYRCQSSRVGTKATVMPYWDFIVASQLVHQATVLFSALNGETTSRPSASRNAAGLAARAATEAAIASGVSEPSVVMSGCSRILNDGSTWCAAS